MKNGTSLENPENVTSAEMVVGIPSYNEADSISYPTEVASRGLDRHFPTKRSVIINVDNIEALLPFYRSRILSFVNKTVHMDTQRAEEYLENITRVFEGEKHYFIKRWNVDQDRLGNRLLE